MVIQHNISALYANTQLNKTSKSIAKSTEKLSSGYKVNRAADDAAGLTISEKMRWQIRGLNQATRNAQDGISLIQVADGALNEMHDVIQRINELATQAANDTNTEFDRDAIQSEIGELQKEINRISDDTMFNTMPVLKVPPLVDIDTDDYANAKLTDPVTIDGKSYPHSKAMDFSKITSSDLDKLVDRTFKVHCSQGCAQEFVFSFTNSGASSAVVDGSNSSRPNINVTINVNDVSNGTELAQKIYDLTATKNSDIANAAPGQTNPLPSGATYIGHDNGMIINGGKLTFFALDNADRGYIEANELELDAVNLHLQVGALKEQDVEVKLKTINCKTLGLTPIPLDVSNFNRAGETMKKAQNAINGVSKHRSYFGAISNRLDHTINNLMNTSENTQNAESAIRDTDMAKEMVNLSINNILAQANQSMLSQAAKNPQSVLSLLS